MNRKQKHKFKKEYKQFWKNFVKWDWRNFCFFLIDVIVFLSIIIVFSVNWKLVTGSNKSDLSLNLKISKYYLLISSFYLLFKFILINFFFSNSYFKKIVIYENKIIIDNQTIKIKKITNYHSFWFLFFYLFINIIVAIIINDEAQALFNNQKIFIALIGSISSLLLIPSFFSSLNMLSNKTKIKDNKFKKLISQQFLANLNLFDKYQAVNNFQFVKLNNGNFHSQTGLFFLTSFSDTTLEDKIINENNKIFFTYQLIWKQYLSFLFLKEQFINDKKFIYLFNHLEPYFDYVFLDFFDFDEIKRLFPVD